MFIEVSNKIVNLKNVSNVNIEKNFNKKQFKIFFNLSHNIDLEVFDKIDGKLKTIFISDYVLWEAKSLNKLLENLLFLEKHKYFKDNFVKKAHGDGFINKNQISSIKFEDHKNRVIFNLSHPITFTDFEKKKKLTSEFVYVNCDDYSEFMNYSAYLSNVLLTNPTGVYL